MSPTQSEELNKAIDIAKKVRSGEFGLLTQLVVENEKCLAFNNDELVDHMSVIIKACEWSDYLVKILEKYKEDIGNGKND